MWWLLNILPAVIAVVTLATPSFATVKNWSSAAGGSWFTAENWNPTGIPEASDTVSIALAGTYAIAIDSGGSEIARLVLGADSGVQTLQVMPPPGASLRLNDNSIIGTSGRLHIASHATLEIHGSSITLINNGGVSLDSSAAIWLAPQDSFITETGGAVTLNGSAELSARDRNDSLDAFIVNRGSFTKTGPDGSELTLHCRYRQSSTGTFTLESGVLNLWDFRTNGLVTLAPETRAFLFQTYPFIGNLSVDTMGTVDIQGTASIEGDSTALIENEGNVQHSLSGEGRVSVRYVSVLDRPGTLRVLTGKLSIADRAQFDLTHYVGGDVHIGPNAELQLGSSQVKDYNTIYSDDSTATLTLWGQHMLFEGHFNFSGTVHVAWCPLTNFYPVNTPSIREFIMDSGRFTGHDINVENLRLNGGITNANFMVSSQCSWASGVLSGSGGSAIAVASGTNMDVGGSVSKVLDTRSLIINGTANMTGSGELSLSGGAAITVNLGGSLTIGDSMTVTGTEDTLFNFGVTRVNCPLDTSRLNLYVYNGSAGGRTPGTIDILSGRVECNGEVKNDGIVDVRSSGEIVFERNFRNNGIFGLADGSICTVNDTLHNTRQGTVSVCGSGDIIGSGVVINEGHVGRDSSGLRTVTNSLVTARFENSAKGVLEISADTLTLMNGGTNAGDIYIHAGAVLRIKGVFVNQIAGVIRGCGVLDLDGATFYDNGAITPGAALGELTIVGDLKAAGTISIEIAGRNPGIDYDLLRVNGNVYLGGSLSLARLNGFVPDLTDTFEFMQYSSCSESFASINGTAIPDGKYMEIQIRPTSMVQYVCNGMSTVSVTPPSFSDTVLSGHCDTVTVSICNLGHCPLSWTTSWVQTSPASPNWLTVVEGDTGLLTRTQCATARWAINPAGLPQGAVFSGHVSIYSNDPIVPVTEIPVQLAIENLTVFDVGGGRMDFSGFTAAVAYLDSHGVTAPTRFDVFPREYNESVTVHPIAGASAINTIAFRSAGSHSDPPVLTNGTQPPLIFDGADHVTFDGIELRATLDTSPPRCIVWIKDNADSNRICNLSAIGASLTDTSFVGIRIDADGSDGNLIDSVTVQRSAIAVALGRFGGTSGANNEVRDCVIPECRIGIVLNLQSARVHGNDIHPGYGLAADAVAGVALEGQNPGDTSWVYDNRIHEFRNAGPAWGIRASGSNFGSFRVYNNFFFDWKNTVGSVFGLFVSNGSKVDFSFNSIRINAVLGADMFVAAVYADSGCAEVSLRNNIFELDDPTQVCYSICRQSDLLTSDFNCFFGRGSACFVGRSGSFNYGSLSQWCSGTGNDLNSRQGNPGFIRWDDLHIDQFVSFVDSAGTDIAGVTTDIDGEARTSPPDIGADEYTPINDRIDDLVIRPNIGASGIDLAWSPVAGARSYKIYASDSTQHSTDPTALIGITADTLYTHEGVVSMKARSIYHVIASSATP